MNLPYSSIMVCLNENLKVLMKPQTRKYKFLYYFLCASLSGIIASLVTNPMDVIKTKLQTQNFPSMVQLEGNNMTLPVKYKSLFSSARLITKESGIKFFARGMLPRTIQASISSALTWVSYEFIKGLFLARS